MLIDLAPAIAALRRDVPGLAAVYLFGSFASGDARPDSAVDLAVFAGRPLLRPLLVSLQQGVANTLNRDVDLIDLAAAVVRSVIEKNLDDLLEFSAVALRLPI